MSNAHITAETIYADRVWKVAGTPFHIFADFGGRFLVADKWDDVRYRRDSFTACLDWCRDWAKA